MTSDQVYNQSKKGIAVNLVFRDKEFSGALEQAVDNLIRDFEICSIQLCLYEGQKSLFFINALEDLAHELFLGECLSRMLFEEVADKMRHHYNSDSRKSALKSKMDGLELSLFMQSIKSPMFHWV